jgi:protein-S-isoprenylcysteine O-methyltransferase Ste14
MELESGLLLYYSLSVLITLSVVSLFVSLFIDFSMYGNKTDVKKSKRSIVATGSIVAFYGIYFTILQFGWGSVSFANQLGAIYYLNVFIVLLSTTMIVTGAIINTLGRWQLKGNWADHIRIYEEHTLITSGVYNAVRHPLYTSIILMLFGGCLAYKNLLCAALTVFVFIPFIYYRAKQEENMLREEFAEYDEYKKNTGMFFPKLGR